MASSGSLQNEAGLGSNIYYGLDTNTVGITNVPMLYQIL